MNWIEDIYRLEDDIPLLTDIIDNSETLSDDIYDSIVEQLVGEYLEEQNG